MTRKMNALEVSENSVTRHLFSEGYLFDFFQSVRLLESYFPNGKNPGETSDVAHEQIRFRPHSGLAFPATDVRSVELLDGKPERARIIATFMGLYGVDSPLPVYFYDSIATETDESKPLRDFLDIFNHRLYSLFYRSWKKYRFALHYSKPSTREGLVVRALSLAGLGTKKAVDDAAMPAIRLASFCGFLSTRVRNADGLKSMVAEILGGVQVSVLENIPRWVTIAQRSRIGKVGGFAVGSTACLGERVFDMSGKFRIAIGPLSLQQYLLLLPRGASAKLLQFLVRLYVRDYLDYDVQLNLSTNEIPSHKLGDGESRLGLTTWLGKPRTEITSRVVAYAH
jgi:type VI secretion system protein ImpH